MRFYRPTHFTAEELFAPVMLMEIGEENCWRRINPNLLNDIDIIREKWGDVIYVNIGEYDSRGFRVPMDPDGSEYSSHKHGNATDLVPKNGEFKKFWNFVKGLIEDGTLKYINVMEDFSFTPHWCHVSIMNIDEKLHIILP